MPSDSALQRRRYLFALASAGMIGTAGCLGGSDDTDGNTTGNGSDTKRNDGGPQDGDDPQSGDDSSNDGTDDQPDEVGWVVADPGEPLYTDDPDWRILGHDTGNSFRNPEAEGPTSDPTVQWTFDTNVHSTFDMVHQPAIVDGTVYTRELLNPESSSEAEIRSELVTIDVETGESERHFEVDGLIRRPTVVDGTVYLSVYSEGGFTRPRESLRAYDLDSGEKQWETAGVFKTLAIYPVGERLVVTDTSPAFNPETQDWTPEMRVFDATTGDLQWEYGSGSGQRTDFWIRFGLPIVTEDIAHFPETSEPRNLRTGDAAGQLPSPVRGPLVDGRLFDVGLGDAERAPGAYDWGSLDEAWTRDFSTSGVRSTVVDGTVVKPVVYTESSAQHEILGVDAETGEQLWRIGPTFDDRDFWRVPFPVAGRDLVYCPVSGGAFAVDPDDGTVLWKLDATDGETVLSAGCALAGDTLLIVGEQPGIVGGSTLYAIS